MPTPCRYVDVTVVSTYEKGRQMAVKSNYATVGIAICNCAGKKPYQLLIGCIFREIVIL
jgi:hypothetical protein